MVSLIQIKLFKHIFIFEDGIVIGCDVSEDFTNLAKKYWTEAGVDKKVKGDNGKVWGNGGVKIRRIK